MTSLASTTRALIYARQSKDNADGIERQIADCRRLLRHEGITEARVIVDNDVSASTARGRPGYDGELLPEMEAGGRSVVVVAQTQDRLLRAPLEMENLIDLVERTGAWIRLVRSGFDLTTAMGRATARQAAVWARLEVEQKAERQRRQGLQSAERGEVPSRRAFGHRPDGTTHPEEAAVVRDAFDRLFRGESLVRIAEALNAAGLSSVRGNRWSRKGVAYLLKSPRYVGVRVYHAGQVDEIRARGVWEPIITEAEHEKAVGILSDPSRKPEHLKTTARRWLGAGLYRCGICGGDVRTGHRTVGRVRTYVCRDHAHLSRAGQPTDVVVLRAVRDRLAQPDASDVLVRSTPRLAELRAEAESIRSRISRAVRDYDDEAIDAATLRQVKDRRERELAVVTGGIAAAARSSRLAQLAASPDLVAAFDVAELAVKREVIDVLCVVTLHPSRARAGGPFDESTVEVAWPS